MPIRVLHLISRLDAGGIERWLLSMLEAAPRTRVAMDFCCKGADVGPLAIQARSLGARVHHCPLRPSHLGYLLGLANIVKSGGYSILHNHLETYAGIGTYVARRCGIPVITSFHNTEFPPQALPNWAWLAKLREIYGRMSIRYALRHSDLLTGCSRAVLDHLSNRFQLASGQGQVLYYGIKIPLPLETGQKQALRSELNENGDRILITHIGRFHPQKNHEGLVRIAEKVITEDRRALFVLVGDGPRRGTIENLVRDRNLEGNFTFLGVRSDVERILACSDIFFFPSTWEGFGLVILEAMAAGLPVLASDLPVLRETVVDGITGILWPAQDEEGMAGHLLNLVADPEKRLSLGEAGRERAASEYSLNRAAEELCQVYESLSHS